MSVYRRYLSDVKNTFASHNYVLKKMAHRCCLYTWLFVLAIVSFLCIMENIRLVAVYVFVRVRQKQLMIVNLNWTDHGSQDVELEWQEEKLNCNSKIFNSDTQMRNFISSTVDKILILSILISPLICLCKIYFSIDMGSIFNTVKIFNKAIQQVLFLLYSPTNVSN